MKLTTYINYGGNCADALHFYEQHLGGKIVTMQTSTDARAENFPPGLEKGIIHARIIIGDTLLMASDGPPDKFQPMRSGLSCPSVDSNEEAERLYALLKEGGEIFMPMGETSLPSASPCSATSSHILDDH